MTDNRTFRVLPAQSRAWILAFVVDARQGRRALRIGGAFRSAFGRDTEISRPTRADWNVAHRLANAVGPTWVWIAGLFNHGRRSRTRWNRFKQVLETEGFSAMPSVKMVPITGIGRQDP